MNPQQSAVHANLEPFLVVLFSVTVFVIIHFATSRLSGWNKLAQRFRATDSFAGESWGWQSAIFRGWIQYKHLLTFGADTHGLSISMLRIVGFFHPPLRIPWSEIQVETKKQFFGLFETAHLVLGDQEQVRMRIYGKLVGRLREAAGPAWPLFQSEQAPMTMSAQVGK